MVKDDSDANNSSAVAPKREREKRDDWLTCSSRRTVWTDWWFHPRLCWTSPQLPLVPARGSQRRSPASASFHLSNRKALSNQTLWKSVKTGEFDLPLNSPGTSLYTMSCRVLSALRKVWKHQWAHCSLRRRLSRRVITHLILSCGHVLWTWTSHRGQNLLVSRKATMQVLQTAEAKKQLHRLPVTQ